jgi:hypothetical protein
MADVAQPFGREAKRLLPLDLLEFAGAAFAGAKQRLAQLCRRILLHDAGGALAAQHTAVNGMILVALDIADATVLDVDFDPTPAGAHVTGRVLHFVGDDGRGVDDFSRSRQRLERIAPRGLACLYFSLFALQQAACVSQRIRNNAHCRYPSTPPAGSVPSFGTEHRGTGRRGNMTEADLLGSGSNSVRRLKFDG